MFDLKLNLKHLTQAPGVYLMYDASDHIIYIGKAKNLKRRVSQYFKSHDHVKTVAMVAQIARFEVIVVSSDYEAYLLEQSLIKKHVPKYNIMFKDDKSYPYLYLSDHKFPRLMSTRQKAHKGKGRGVFFGPYISATSLKLHLQILQKLFPIRQCSDQYYQNRSRPCLQYQLKHCTAPCVQYITPESYQEDVALLIQFLQGKHHSLLKSLSMKMQKAADQEAYETAARYRDQLQALRTLQIQQFVDIIHHADYEAYALVCDRRWVVVTRARAEKGKTEEVRHWISKLETMEQSEQSEQSVVALWEAFQLQVTMDVEVHSDEMHPNTHLKQARQLLPKIIDPIPLRGYAKQLQNMAEDNAATKLASILKAHMDELYKIKVLKKAFQITPEVSVKRIECFDVSHFQGEARYAANVVFGESGFIKRDYRRYGLMRGDLRDDYEGLREALERRFSSASTFAAPWPDILIIDGGKGQYGVARAVLEAVGLFDSILLISLGKGVLRISGEEVIHFKGNELYLPPNDEAFLFLREIRDESHRFAITGQRQAMRSNKLRSCLDEVSGIGVKRRKALLEYFGGWQALECASVLEIAKVEGISQVLAEKIWQALH